MSKSLPVFSLTAFFGVTLISLLACTGATTEAPPVAEAPPTTPAAAPGLIGSLDYPTIGTSASSGDFVLAPSREFLDQAAVSGVDKATFIYYGATMVAPGAVESKIKSQTGTEFTLPNSLILHVGRGYSANVGDVVLTQWESGSGLERAIVTGGTPFAPVVRYLDMDWDNPAGIAQKDDMLKADHFRPLTGPGQIGTTVACKSGSTFAHGVMVGLAGSKVLHLGFAGRLSSFSTSDCVALDPRPAVKAGDKVQVPYIGSYTEGTVTRVDTTLGRVWTTITFGGQPKEVAVGWSDVATSLANLGQNFGGTVPAPIPVATPTTPPPPTATDRTTTPDRTPTRIGGSTSEPRGGGSMGGTKSGNNKGNKGGKKDKNN